MKIYFLSKKKNRSAYQILFLLISNHSNGLNVLYFIKSLPSFEISQLKIVTEVVEKAVRLAYKYELFKIIL